MRRPKFPTYQFGETGVGCATHHDVTCLCDVVVGAPAPIMRRPPMFSNMVAKHLGVEKVSVGNLDQWAAHLLGAYDTYQAYMYGEPKPPHILNNPFQKISNHKVAPDTAWGTLDEPVRAMFIACLTSNVDFDAALLRVCERYGVHSVTVRLDGPMGLRNIYNVKRANYFSKENAK